MTGWMDGWMDDERFTNFTELLHRLTTIRPPATVRHDDSIRRRRRRRTIMANI